MNWRRHQRAPTLTYIHILHPCLPRACGPRLPCAWLAMNSPRVNVRKHLGRQPCVQRRLLWTVLLGLGHVQALRNLWRQLPAAIQQCPVHRYGACACTCLTTHASRPVHPLMQPSLITLHPRRRPAALAPSPQTHIYTQFARQPTVPSAHPTTRRPASRARQTTPRFLGGASRKVKTGLLARMCSCSRHAYAPPPMGSDEAPPAAAPMHTWHRIPWVPP